MDATAEVKQKAKKMQKPEVLILRCVFFCDGQIQLQECVPLVVYSSLFFSMCVGWGLHHLAVAGLAGCQ